MTNSSRFRQVLVALNLVVGNRVWAFRGLYFPAITVVPWEPGNELLRQTRIV